MPRQARRLSKYGFLHIITRGVGRQILFEERCDYIYYLKKLKKYSEEMGIEVHAYCLMSNHVHLLIRDRENEVSLFMKKMGVSYSAYYNKKYDRVGHLFQSRYISEAIESEKYFFTVFRYILNNPKKAGICAAKDYEWSSYSEYFENNNSIVQIKIIRDTMGNKKNFELFIDESNTNDIADKSMGHDHTDRKTQKLVQMLLRVQSGTELQSYSKRQRDYALRLLKSKGITVREIERITGINRGVVQRA